MAAGDVMTEAQGWSVRVRLADVARSTHSKRLEADESQRTSIAEELGIDRLDWIEAEVALSPWMDGAIVDGRWSAQIEQTCGVSLESFATRLEGSFSVRVLPNGSPNAPDHPVGEVVVDPTAEDPPDVLEGDEVDLAGYVVEHLALEIDPFPRKPGAVFTPPDEPKPPSPFDALRNFSPRAKDD